jgi:type IV pilus assembly protein PilN
MIRINLLPVRAIRAEFGRRQQLTIAGIAIGITVVLALGAHVLQWNRLSNLQDEREELQGEIQTLNAKVKQVSALRKQIGDLKGKKKVIDELAKKKIGPVRVMESLSSATPARLWLTEFKETAGSLAISGMAVDNQTIADFLKALSASGHFRNVELVETTQVEQEGVQLKKFSVKSGLVYDLPTPPAAEKAAAAAKQEKKG